jgi:N6-L-threonylcarbamoyladenine synthase
VAVDGNPAAYDFPRSMLHDPHLDFSFSGLKTAVLYALQKEKADVPVADLSASFQKAVIEILVGKTLKAVERSGRKVIALSGGVSLNKALRGAFQEACDKRGIRLEIASPDLCTDNAAMIAFAGLLRHLNGETSRLDDDIFPNLPLV